MQLVKVFGQIITMSAPWTKIGKLLCPEATIEILALICIEFDFESIE